MSVKSILFNTEMVRAILDGEKTVTRRVVKRFVPDDAQFGYTAFTPKGCISVRGIYEDGYGEKFYKLPYQPGDILWVRETWRKCAIPAQNSTGYQYKADNSYFADFLSWRPSVHMPREAARIWLHVTDVRVQRLQDCGNMQAKDEGYTCCSQFARVWDSTIKPADRDRHGWKANPWVWVISFERCEKPVSF